jgi:hypothetical protein
MSDRPDDPDLLRLTADLARSLRDLQRELEPRRRGRPPSPRTLLRFADEVAIPAAILVLETNVRALQLLQRAIRLADDRPGGSATTETAVRDRAADLSRVTLERLDGALADVQDAIEGRPPDDDARQLLDEARDLRAEIDARLQPDDGAVEGPTDAGDEGTETTDVPVDVDAELQSIRDEIDDDDQP